MSPDGLSPEQWARVKAVFDPAVALDAAERAAYLARACGGDDAVRRQVELMLASHDHAPAFLETPAAVLLEEIPTPDDLIGRTIGAYRLVARIGAGGRVLPLDMAMWPWLYCHDDANCRRQVQGSLSEDPRYRG